MAIEVRLERREIGSVIAALERELERLRKRLQRVEAELREYEERYGMPTREFMRMYEECARARGEWRLPEEADLDAVEWHGLALAREEIVEEVENIEKVLSRLR
ncbi:hypothetical protein [Pyrodictium abyssi]|uniref:Uncharacterized protein n=1 Tax=Pyrodictium abyssi TaxID=54256 RepID=A0ABM8IW84_9CREN|nr:hypothetical protein PABY_13920 [Pyrodictium abyssi]